MNSSPWKPLSPTTYTLQFHYGEKSHLCDWIKGACLRLMYVWCHTVNLSLWLAPLFWPVVVIVTLQLYRCGWWSPTLLCAYTTDPSSFHVPPLRSMRTIRRIWRNRRLRSAEVAKMLPWLPAETTATEAMSTMISVALKKSLQRHVTGTHGFSLISRRGSLTHVRAHKHTHTQYPTYNTERLPGKAESSLPASVAAAAASAPDPDDVLQTENYDHYKLLQHTTHTKQHQAWKTQTMEVNNNNSGDKCRVNHGAVGDELRFNLEHLIVGLQR